MKKPRKPTEPQRPPNPLPDVHFRITADEYRHLQAVAKAMDRSVAYLITKIVRDWIQQKDGGETNQQQ